MIITLLIDDDLPLADVESSLKSIGVSKFQFIKPGHYFAAHESAVVTDDKTPPPTLTLVTPTSPADDTSAVNRRDRPRPVATA